MIKVRREKSNGVQLFHKILDVLFLSPQMSDKKGFKLYGHSAVESIIKEFKQFNEGVFPGKLVVELIGYENLTEEELRA